MNKPLTLYIQLILAASICITVTSPSHAIQAAPDYSAPWVGDTLTGKPCKGKAQGFGPFDYNQRFSFQRQLRLVEGAHFTNDVKNLIKGRRGTLAGDIDYTLRAWPNHHEALQAITRYQYIHENLPSKEHKYGTVSPVECYFQRAINFSPNDEVVIILYSIYLHKRNEYQKAREYYEKGLAISPDNRSIHYNYGLLLANMKKYDEAVTHAKKAYDAGYPLDGLKNILIKAGHWPHEANSDK